MEFDDLSNRVIGCAVEVHRQPGPGRLESAYEQCLAHELRQNEIAFQLQHPQPVQYTDIRLDCGYRIDILAENKLIPELRSVEQIKGIHECSIVDLHEIGWREDRIADQLQQHQTERRHQAFRSLIPSCSPCPSWWSVISRLDAGARRTKACSGAGICGLTSLRSSRISPGPPR